MSAMRLGLLGGTFDPVHYGHLLLAECCREQARLDQVWFLPAALPPHKQQLELSPGEDRIAMLELAIGGHEPFSVCRLEIERGGVSFTVDTMTELKRTQPDCELFFLLGGDSLLDLPNWKDPERICRLALPLVVRRPGAPEPDFMLLAKLLPPEKIEAIRRSQVAMPLMELSSRDIRRRVADGLSIRYRTPRAVEKYIAAHSLYQKRAATPKA
jgi:nicotinate-nucleotide adenylyltransferase